MPELFVDPDALMTNGENGRSYKRPYKKSTSGCRSCKARKIKVSYLLLALHSLRFRMFGECLVTCSVNTMLDTLTRSVQCDEQRPVCTNCKRRFVNIACCEYSLKILKSSKIPSVSSCSPTPLSHAPIRPQQQISLVPFQNGHSDRVLELRLFHHYVKTTCDVKSLRDLVPVLAHPMWEIDIPQMAFSSPIVLDALLGISALHLFALQPTDHSMAVASRSYFNKAVAQQRYALSTLNAENAETLLVTAVLIAHYSWLTNHLTGQPEKRYKVQFLQTYHMCLGINALIRRATPWLEKYSQLPEASRSSTAERALESGFMKRAFRDLTSLSAHFHKEGVPFDDSAAYEKATEELAAIYHLLMEEHLDVSRAEQIIVTILHRLPLRFVELLEAEDCIAMALLARNLSLLTFLEISKAWWLHGAGEQKVSNAAVLGIRALIPPEWLWIMEWPMSIIRKEATLDME